MSFHECVMGDVRKYYCLTCTSRCDKQWAFLAGSKGVAHRFNGGGLIGTEIKHGCERLESGRPGHPHTVVSRGKVRTNKN